MTCGKLEIEILNSVWKLLNFDEDRDISIQDVVNDLASCGINRAYTTIKTVMDRLVAKSVLVRYKSGKKFFYKSVLNRHEMALDSVREVATQFFNSDYSNMVKFIESEFGLIKS